MFELRDKEIDQVSGGFWPVVAAVGAAAAWAWANRADLMEVADAAAAKNDKLNSEH